MKKIILFLTIAFFVIYAGLCATNEQVLSQIVEQEGRLLRMEETLKDVPDLTAEKLAKSINETRGLIQQAKDRYSAEQYEDAAMFLNGTEVKIKKMEFFFAVDQQATVTAGSAQMTAMLVGAVVLGLGLVTIILAPKEETPAQKEWREKYLAKQKGTEAEFYEQQMDKMREHTMASPTEQANLQYLQSAQPAPLPPPPAPPQPPQSS